MDYKVGEKVRVILNPPFDTKEWPSWVSDMNRYSGQIFIIKELMSNGKERGCYLSGNSYAWNLKWIVPASNFIPGDAVMLMSTGELKVLDDYPLDDSGIELISRKKLI